MKSFIFNLMFILSITSGIAQDKNKATAELPFDDYKGLTLSSSAEIPDYQTKPNTLKISGIVYQADGTTPASDVILYLYQHDENGDFQYEVNDGVKRLRHRGWVKTDSNGRYTFNTFIPGEAIVPLNYPRRYGPKQIYLMAKTTDSQVINLPAFMFEGDDLLSKSCRKRLEKKGIDCILNPVEEEGILVADQDIVLPSHQVNSL
jgi:protocatechuate 3,4-dioxygenase beta subunit